jgi:hypothetical protein
VEYSGAGDFTDFKKIVYRQGKVYEIPSHQLQQKKDGRNGLRDGKLIRMVTVENIERKSANPAKQGLPAIMRFLTRIALGYP